MTGWKLFQPSELPVAKPFIECRSLETEAVQIDAAHPSTARLRFGGLHQRAAPAFATMLIGHPKQAHEHPAKKSFRGNAADDLAAVADRHSQPTMVELPDRGDIV